MSEWVPDFETALLVAPLALAYAGGCAALTTRLRARGLKTPYTRKAFHFLIISLTPVVHLAWGLGAVVTYGSVTAVLVLLTVIRGDGFGFYEALARPTDAPHRSLFIVIPLVTTAVGGFLTLLLFPAFAAVGFLALAWGDAVGEPVGTRWGRHRYRVPSLFGVPAQRSIEGSAAVAATTAAAAALALLSLGVPPAPALAAAIPIGGAGALVEAVSHHGLDNLTMQLATAAVAALLLG